MYQKIKITTVLFWLVTCALFVYPIWAALSVNVTSYGLIDHFHLAIHTPIYYLFPLIVSLYAVLPLHQQLANNYLTYTRVRRDTRSYLMLLATKSAVIVALVFFLYILVSFYAIDFLANQGVIKYYPELFPDLDIQQYRTTGYSTFTQFVAYSKHLYIFIYAAWVALNAVTYAFLAFAIALLIRNRVVAIITPLLAVVLSALIFELIGSFFKIFMQPYMFWHSVFAHTSNQNLLVAVAPTTFLMLVTLWLWAIIIRRPAELKVLH